MGKAKRIKGLWIAFVVTVTLIMSLVFILLFAFGEIRLFYDAKVTEIFICDGLDPVTGLPTPPTNAFRSDTKQRFVCGYLQTSSPVRLDLLLFYEDKPVEWFALNQKYRQGYFFEPLPHDKGHELQSGIYRVDVYRARHKLASTEFVVTAKEQ